MTATMTASREAIDAFLAVRAIGIVGVSRSGGKFGNVALRTLREKGYVVYPVHPGAQMIDGGPCVEHVSDLPKEVEGLLIVVHPTEAAQVLREAAGVGIRHVWLQQGAESPAVIQLCKDLGLDAVVGECILMFAKPTGVHKIHRWVNGVLGRLPT